jgi:hypothetical protein
MTEGIETNIRARPFTPSLLEADQPGSNIVQADPLDHWF